MSFNIKGHRGFCIIHGQSGTPLHKIWKGMRRRCMNKNDRAYKWYGGRGIKICKRWDSFQNFFDDMAPTYMRGLTIERVDNNSGYSPENCVWATKQVQNINRRSTLHLKFKGKTRMVSEWAKLLGGNPGVIHQRIYKGWSVERALSTPVGKHLTFNGKTLTAAAWARELKVKTWTLYGRLRAGWSVEKTLSEPVRKNA